MLFHCECYAPSSARPLLECTALSSQAAINGESWKAPTLAWGPGAAKKEDDQQVKTIPDAPSVPPPRPPPQAAQSIGAPPSQPPPRIQ